METPISICMTTYKSSESRGQIAHRTWDSLQRYINYPNIIWHIADDGSEEGYTDSFEGEYTVTNALRKGVGYSKNLALRQLFEQTPLVLLLEDDWELQHPLDLSPYVHTLLENESTGMIRMGYLSTDMQADLVGYSGMTYLRLKRGSGVYVYSGQVSLRHRRFYDSVGYHAEGISAGSEELDMCFRYNATEDAPEILWPGNMGFHFQCSPFLNIGMGESLNRIDPA